MKLITKENLLQFVDYYHGFHDSHITALNYNIAAAKIECLIDVYWSGEPTITSSGVYETNKTKVRIIFNEIEQCNNKAMFAWDYINNPFIDYVNIKNKEFICFADDQQNPLVYIVCESMEYEELNS